jgi:hypothetical protein
MKGDAESAPNTSAIAQTFRNLDFHDNTFVDMKVFPTQTPGDIAGSVIEIELLQHPDEKRTLRFLGCANLKVGIDFDVLAHNLAPNTSGVDAHTDKALISELMISQECDWDVGYAGTSSNPLHKKLDLLDELICFRVQFFGGLVEIIARQYQVEDRAPQPSVRK